MDEEKMRVQARIFAHQCLQAEADMRRRAAELRSEADALEAAADEARASAQAAARRHYGFGLVGA